MKAVAGIWVRKVPPNNFFSIERHSSAGPVGGGGALYIEAPTSTVPALLELLGYNPQAQLEEELAIPTRVIGDPMVVADLRWNSKTGNRLRLFQNRQSGTDVRHPAWAPERGFPKAPDNVADKDDAAAFITEGLRVYVVLADDGDYYAGFLTGGYPSDWPDNDDLRGLFEGAGGVKQFSSGLHLVPEDARRPFRTDLGDVVVEPGGVIDAGEDVPGVSAPSVAGHGGYASPETSAAVDDVAMELALDYAEERFPGAHIQRMPHNNPGYDIAISDANGLVRYIEVKGTMHSAARFFLSERERRFSEDNAEIYTLVVFYGIDLDARTGAWVQRDGGIDEKKPELTLTITQWHGIVPTG